MKKYKSIVIVAIMAALGLLPISSSYSANNQTFELRFNSMFPAQYGMGIAAEQWAREVEKRTAGRMKITMYHAGTLSPASEIYENVAMGASDIGQSCLAYTRGRFPLLEVIDLPGYTFNALVTSRVADEICRKFKPEELSDVHLLYMHAHIPGIIYTRDKAVHSLDDLKGLRIRSTGLSTKIIENLGATPVAMSKSDQYDAMLKGVVDGTLGCPNELKGYRVAEVAKNSTVYPKVGYVTAMFVVMNLDKWNSLPEDIKSILDEVSHEWVEKSGNAWNEIETEGIAFGKQKGHNFIKLSSEEGTKWEDALKPTFANYVEEMKKKNLPGEQALEFRNELIKKYSKLYPPLEF